MTDDELADLLRTRLDDRVIAQTVAELLEGLRWLEARKAQDQEHRA